MMVIHSKGFLDWLRAAGLIPENTRRVVIEASVDSAVVIYAELFGAKEMLEIEPPAELKGAQIRILGKGE